MAAVEYGTIGIRPRGEWEAPVQYELLNLVTFDGSSYVVHTKPPVGTLPTDMNYWQVSAQGTSKATATTPGTVMPDGITTEVKANGAMSVKTATQITPGAVKGSESINVQEDGRMDLNTEFTESDDLDNILPNEEFPIMLGKISQAIKETIRMSQITKPKSIRLDCDSFGLLDAPAGKLFIDLISKSKGYDLTNAAVSGKTLFDAWKKITSEITLPSPYDIHFINLGFNDVRRWGDVEGIAPDVAARMVQLVKYLRLKNIVKHNDESIVYSGTWLESHNIDGSILGDTKYTGDQSSSATFNFTGSNLSIGTFALKEVNTNGTIEITIDGTVVKTITMSRWEGRGEYGATVLEVTGLSDSAHTCVFKKIDASANNIYFDWYGVPSDNPPTVIINGITKMLSASYADPAFTPFIHGSASAIADTNKVVRSNLAWNFDEKVIFIDQSDYDPDNNYLVSADSIHPNDFGHSWIADNVLKRI